MIESVEFKKRHSRDCFYKYTNISSAKLILREGRLLAQSPLNFNDPFDVQIGFHYDFGIIDGTSILQNKLMELIESNDIPVFKRPCEMADVVIKMRSGYLNGSLTKESIIKITKPFFDKISYEIENIRQEFIQSRKAIIKRMRMVCLTTTPENLLMWSHYSDEHKGVVIKFKVAENESDDDPLWLPEKVNYCEEAQPLMTREEFANFTFGLELYPSDNLDRRIALNKFKIWEYEDEYRFYDIVEEYNTTKYTIGISPKRVEAVYFGVNTLEDDIHEIIKIGSSLNQEMKYYKANKHKSQFKIYFEKI